MTFKWRMNSMKGEFLINRQVSNFYRIPQICKNSGLFPAESRGLKLSEFSTCGSYRADRSNSIELIPILDVKPGDYVLSLNEETQKIEPHRINGLLDMGVKPVFKLTTKDGRSIKTTGNHPYLTEKGWKKVVELDIGQRIAVPKGINGRVSYRGDDIQNKLVLSTLQELLSQLQSFPLFFTSFWVDNYTNKDKKYAYNTDEYSPYKWELLEKITGQSDHKNRLTQICGSLSNKFYFSLFSIFHCEKLYHSLDALSSNAYADTAMPVLDSASSMPRSNNILRTNASAIHVSPVEKPALSEVEGSDILWDRIVSIEYIGYEQVYDIEVEGTHNFIGNGILAHNTYLNAGNVGIGTTAPGAKLAVAGGDMSLQTSKKIIMDSDDSGDTYMVHDSTNDRVSIYVDGIEMVRINK